MNLFSGIFLGALAAMLLTQLWLARRQIGHVAACRDRVPAPFAGSIPLEAHQRAADYTVAKVRLGQLEAVYGAALLVLWTLFGGLDQLDQLWYGAGFSSQLTGICVLLSAFLLFGLLELPFSLYRTFRLEQQFGFNHTTVRVYAADVFKQALLLLLLGGPLASLVLWLMARAGQWWWLDVWCVWMAFNLLVLWAYPAFIAPLFNRFTPLENAELRQRIEALLQRCGFTSSGIFVMDGSRRSTHGNAYFTGLGNNKRIVFFDTLLQTLGIDEVEAVLAHELGHFRRRHVQQRLIVGALTSLVGLGALGWLTGKEWFYHGLGVGEPSLHMALLLFLLVIPVFTFLLQPLLTARMRRHEFEADDFAAANADAAYLVSALVKLYRENASTLTPDRLYSAFYDSHPPAPVRVAHLSAKLQS